MLQMVHQISRTLVKPSPSPQLTTPKQYHLTPWDLSMLSLNYIECGLLFHNQHTDLLIKRLETSLSRTLFHFYPLAGRLITKKEEDDSISISIVCNNEGAELIHSSAHNLTVDDVLAPNEDVPSFVKSFFPYHGAANYDGHFLPLLAVQVIELVDGIFIGCSMNHVIADGISFWNFFRAWADICQTNVVTLSHEPILDRWFADGVRPPIKLPFSSPDKFVDRYSPPPNICVRVFHFPSQSIARLKLVANDECKTTNGDEISTFQVLCSLIWRSITRARRIQPNQKTACRLASNDRSKLRPPLSMDYFGNYVTVIGASTSVGDLLTNSLSWGAQLVHQRVVEHDDTEIQNAMRVWMDAPVILSPCKINPLNLSILSSPKFGVYKCDFGWGKPMGLRTGCTFFADGVVAAYPGRKGGGSVDMEVYLIRETMEALESDEEFMNVVSHD